MSSPTTPKSPKGKEPMRVEEPGQPKAPAKGTPSKPTTPPRIGFGIELEFVIAESNGFDPDADLAHRLPPLIEVGTARKKVLKLLESKGFPVHDAKHLNHQVVPSDAFLIDDDATAMEPAGYAQGYQWGSVEICSAAQYATEEAFDMIRLLVSLVTTNFRCRVNERTGFHAHVSNGFDRIEGRHARKYAALIWAAEPMLTFLHPPERAFGRWASSIRRAGTTPLANGVTAEQTRQRLGEDNGKDLGREYGRARDYGDLTAPALVSNHISDLKVWRDGNPDSVDWEAPDFKPFQRPELVRHQDPEIKKPTFINKGRKGIKAGPPMLHTVAQATKPYTFERTGERSDNYRPLEYASHPGTVDRGESIDDDNYPPEVSDSWSGILQMLSADVGTHQVARLVGDLILRNNWNFRHLGTAGGVHSMPAWLPDEYIKPEFLEQRRMHAKERLDEYAEEKPTCHKLTVECREAAGSLEPEWIVTWAKICCGLLEFSRDAEPSYFMSVLDKCAQATDYGLEYDVVDLLRDMGLFSEANHCEKRLARREEAWIECMLLRWRDTVDVSMQLAQEAHATLRNPFSLWANLEQGGSRGEGSSSAGSASGLSGDGFGDIEGVREMASLEPEDVGFDMFRSVLDFDRLQKASREAAEKDEPEHEPKPEWW